MNTTENVLDLRFALFNCHLNDAENRANAAFVKRFGQDAFDENIQPFLNKGIMAIFNEPPNKHTKWYVETVAVFVNEDRETT